MDFVVGYEVKLTQNGKHVPDICDDLAGKYPKDFKFSGWHPHCLCYTLPILKTEEEFLSLDDTKPSVNAVTDTPANFKQWVRDNKERIEIATERGTLPYFLRDNTEVWEKVLYPERYENLKYFSRKDFEEIQNGRFFGATSIIKSNEILLVKGFSKEEIEQMNKLFDFHRHGGANQIDTDIEIAIHFRDKNSKLGEILRTQSEIEEEAYRIYRYNNPPLKITRAGDLSRDTFSFTLNKDGVVKIIDGEEIYWGANIKTTIDEILKEHRLVAGLLRSDIGYSDERELFFVSKNPKQLTDSFIRDWKKKKEQKRLEAERQERHREFNKIKDEVAMNLMSLMSKGVRMDKIFQLQNELIAVTEGDMKSLSRMRTLSNAAERHANRTEERTDFLKRWAKNHTDYFKYKSDPNYIDVKFDKNSGGLKGLHKGHIIHSHPNDEIFFEKYSSTDLEARCQNILFKNGRSCILENEIKIDINTGNQISMLDTITDGEDMDIRSITKNNRNTIKNGIDSKKNQIKRYNLANNKSASSLILYFENPEYFNRKKIIQSIGGQIKKIICVLNEGDNGKIIELP